MSGRTKDINYETKDMKRFYHNAEIYEYTPFAKALVAQFFDQYKTCAYIEESFCCYGLKTSCWSDIEGEYFGWIFKNYEVDNGYDGIRQRLLSDMNDIMELDCIKSARIIVSKNKSDAEVRIITENQSNYRFLFGNKPIM